MCIRCYYVHGSHTDRKNMLETISGSCTDTQFPQAFGSQIDL